MWIVNEKLDASGKQKYKIVIDYKSLNSKTKSDTYQVPDISVVLAHLKNNKYFTTLNLTMDFYQISLNEGDREKAAFSVNNQKYEFNILPMGLKNSPAIFQRVIDDVLRVHIGIICYVYIDDIIVTGKDLKDHTQNLETIFKALTKANLKIHPDKSEFLKKEIAFFGFIVSQDSIKHSMDKIAAISEYPEPTNLRELRSFLGLSSYYRRFILDYAKIARPLTKLLKVQDGNAQVSKQRSKKYPINLNPDQKQTFQRLKKILTSDDVLIYPDFKKSLISLQIPLIMLSEQYYLKDQLEKIGQ